MTPYQEILWKKDTETQRVPDGGSTFGDFVSRLFVPNEVISSWGENDRMLRARQVLIEKDPGLFPRLTSSAAMLASYGDVRSYVDSPFIGDTYQREVARDTADAVAESASAVASKVADSTRGALNTGAGFIFRALPWWVWALAAVALVAYLAPLLSKIAPTRS